MPDIRWMTRRDLPEVLEMPPIDNVRLSEDEAIALLSERHNIGMITRDDNNQTTGYVFYSIDSENELGKVLFIFKLAFNNYDTLSFMLQSLKGKLNERRKSIEIYVQETKLGLQNMLKSKEFLAIGVIPNYYKKIDSLTGFPQDPVAYEDAYHMRYVI